MRSRFLVELAVVAAALWEERPRTRPASPCGGWLSHVPLERAIEIRFGARAVKGPDLVRDIKAIIATKIPLCAVAEDLADRGIQSSQLVPGIEQIQRSGIARLIEGNDRILSW